MIPDRVLWIIKKFETVDPLVSVSMVVSATILIIAQENPIETTALICIGLIGKMVYDFIKAPVNTADVIKSDATLGQDNYWKYLSKKSQIKIILHLFKIKHYCIISEIRVNILLYNHKY